MKSARYFWLGCAAVGAWASTMPAFAQGAAVPSDQSVAEDSADEIVVIDYRAANEAAQNIKRQAPSLVEAITFEDLGKFMNTSFSEALKRVHGVQIEKLKNSRGGRTDNTSIRGFTGAPIFAMSANLMGRQASTTNCRPSIRWA